jgi:hypothetical protein
MIIIFNNVGLEFSGKTEEIVDLRMERKESFQQIQLTRLRE